MRVGALLLGLFIAGCATIPTVVALRLPEQPDVPAIPAAQMQCLTDEAYETLVLRERLYLNHIETLETIIQSTH